MFGEIFRAVLNGVVTGLYPIGLVIIAALFTYAITTETGGVGVIREGLAKLSDDSRVMVLLVVWGFGNFMEGMAGFGTAVAIPVAILVGVGFDPMKAVLCCLVANTTPTAFGSVGVPTMVLANEAACEIGPLTYTIVKASLPVTALGPFLILLVADGWKGVRERWGMAVLADVAFLVPWLFMAQVGCELPNVVSGLCVMVALALCGKWRELDVRQQLRAWLPFLMVIAFLAVGSALSAAYKVSPGILILAAALIAGFKQGLSVGKLLKLLGATVNRYKKAVIIICAILAGAKVLGALGVIKMIADGLVAIAGDAYPAFAPIIGALGSFITGSGTSANVLFGHLQASVAKDAAQVLWLAAANVMGAGIGKMICPQSIVLGCAAAGIAGCERQVLRKAIWIFIPILLIACMVMAGR